ncbi:hypothetical protein ABIA39_008342 [Nocardia sp. GAS34]|uniref:hypothetical protein n=1 Tax=unclassified Nocardia TaxID=2637762 RepID=UPI003D260DD4
MPDGGWEVPRWAELAAWAAVGCAIPSCAWRVAAGFGLMWDSPVCYAPLLAWEPLVLAVTAADARHRYARLQTGAA